MAAFGGLIQTNKGRALQAKAQTGVTLTFTRIGCGDGSLSGQSILTLNALISEKMSLDITKLKTLTDNKAVVGAVLSNQGLATGFYFREIGVFAQDPDEGEILYAYGNAGPNAEYIPAGGGPDIVEKNIELITIIGNAANVDAVIDESLVYVTYPDFNNHLSAAVLDHPDGSVTTAKLAGGAATDEKIGNRTIDDTQTPTGNTGLIGTLFSWIGNMFKLVTGELSWRTNPATNLKAAKAHMDSTSNPHGVTTLQIGAETPAGAQSKVNAHADRTDNPHGVTPGQIGAETPTGAQAKVDAHVNNATDAHNASAISVADTAGNFTSTQVEGVLSELFQNVDNLKDTVAAAIVDMNQSADGTYTADQLAAAIRSISSDANLPTNYALDGYTFYEGGLKRIGTMPNRGAQVITPSTVNQAIPDGYHNGSGYVVGDAQLLPQHIEEGVTIFNVTGTLKAAPTFSVTPLSYYNENLTPGTSYYDTIVNLSSGCLGFTVYPDPDNVYNMTRIGYGESIRSGIDFDYVQTALRFVGSSGSHSYTYLSRSDTGDDLRHILEMTVIQTPTPGTYGIHFTTQNSGVDGDDQDVGYYSVEVVLGDLLRLEAYLEVPASGGSCRVQLGGNLTQIIA